VSPAAEKLLIRRFCIIRLELRMKKKYFGSSSMWVRNLANCCSRVRLCWHKKSWRRSRRNLQHCEPAGQSRKRSWIRIAATQSGAESSPPGVPRRVSNPAASIGRQARLDQGTKTEAIASVLFSFKPAHNSKTRRKIANLIDAGKPAGRFQLLTTLPGGIRQGERGAGRVTPTIWRSRLSFLLCHQTPVFITMAAQPQQTRRWSNCATRLAEALVEGKPLLSGVSDRQKQEMYESLVALPQVLRAPAVYERREKGGKPPKA